MLEVVGPLAPMVRVPGYRYTDEFYVYWFLGLGHSRVTYDSILAGVLETFNRFFQFFPGGMIISGGTPLRSAMTVDMSLSDWVDEPRAAGPT